jgi:hypothetical protein
MPSKQHIENEKSGQQGTNEPWKKPGQTSQDPAIKPPDEPRTDKDQKTAKTTAGAVLQAEAILAAYIEPGPRDCEQTINKLLDVIDTDRVIDAAEKIAGRATYGQRH